MEFTIQAKTYAECADFLKLVFDGQEYTLSEFSAAFKRKEFDLDQMLPQCEILYRGQKKKFEEYLMERRELAKRLAFFTRCRDVVQPIEINLAIGDPEYYQAAKFLEKAETCLQTARYYFIKSTDILEYDCCVHWQAGYLTIYGIRSMNFSTAIIWYNNCFDYIIQVAFLAFSLYRGIKRYSENLTFEEILKMCTYNALKTLHNNEPDNVGLTNLWNIIEECRVSRQDLNDWANYFKHKGGLGFIGLKPEFPVQVFVGNPNGDFKSRISEFEAITLDMDCCIEKVVSAHEALIKCLHRLMDFINFPAGQCSINSEGKFVLPDKNTYRKVRLEKLNNPT